jgi:hypothetical protein
MEAAARLIMSGAYPVFLQEHYASRRVATGKMRAIRHVNLSHDALLEVAYADKAMDRAGLRNFVFPALPRSRPWSGSCRQHKEGPVRCRYCASGLAIALAFLHIALKMSVSSALGTAPAGPPPPGRPRE